MKKRNTYAKVIYVIFAFLVLMLLFNVIYLTVTGKTLISHENIRDFNKLRGGGQVTKVVQAKRGSIYTSDNKIVASDIKKYNVYAVLSSKRISAKGEPAYVVDKKKTAEVLSKNLGTSYDYIYNKLKRKTYQVEFGTAGKHISALVKQKIDKENLTGLEWSEVTSRNYSLGDFASYEVGYAYVADSTDPYTISGQMGIEKSYNSWLAGKNGKSVYLEDSNHNRLPNGTLSETDAVDGKDVYLTINSALQTQLDSSLKEMAKETEAKVATCAVMEAKTGKILAISNYPSFDPNKRNFKTYEDRFLNVAIEPGSVFKSFVYANALSDGVLNLADTYQSGHYNYKVNGKLITTIHDHNLTGWGRITYEDGLYHSSNVAICEILMNKSNMKSLIQDYSDLGFFKSSKVDGLNSGSGVAGYDGKNKNLEYLTTGFGQGSSVTGLQLLRAYSAFANDGKTVEPYLVDKVVDSSTNKTVYKGKSTYSKKIFSSTAVSEIRKLLYGVVNGKDGTGKPYHSDEIDIIGKTGTGQVAINGKYSKSYYSHAFVGLAPYDNPEVEIVIWYQNTKGGTKYAGKLVQEMVKSTMNVIAGNEKTVKSSTYKLSSYVNQSTDYATKLLSKHSVTPIVIGDGKSVVAQYPSANSEVVSSSHVMLLTDGKKMTMPSMENWSRKDAEAFAQLSGIKLKIKGVGTIYKQSVSKGDTIKKGQSVTVYAS